MKTLDRLVLGWIFSMGTVYLLELPYVGNKVQLPELMFLGVLFGLFLSNGFHAFLFPSAWQKMSGAFRWEKSSILLLTALLVSMLFHFSLTTIIELTGLAYLFVTALLIQIYALRRPSFEDFIPSVFARLSLLLAIVNLMLMGLYLGGISLPGDWVEVKYIPFLGNCPRIRGAMPSPALLASLMSVGLFFVVSRKGQGILHFFKLALILFGLILTFSKSLILILPLALALFIRVYVGKKRNWFFNPLIFLFAIVLILFTHFVPIPSQKIDEAEASYLSEEVWIQTDDWQLRGTSYWMLKKAIWTTFGEAPLVGVGPGMFRQHLAGLQEDGRYPGDLPLYDPHSTFFGLLAELGLMGWLAFLFWAVVLFQMFRRLIKGGPPEKQWLYRSLLAFFLLSFVESMFTDILNFRHMWILLGLLAFEYKTVFHDRKQ